MSPAARRRRRGRGLVGRDFNHHHHRRRRPRVVLTREQISIGVALLLGLLFASLLLAALRMAIVRTRYALAGAAETEIQLLERERQLAVTVRRLRDPRRLQALADEWGFARPERVVILGGVADGRIASATGKQAQP